MPSPDRRASSPAPTAPPAGPESTLQAPAVEASSHGGRSRPRRASPPGPAGRARRSPREAGRGSARAGGRGRRRSPWSSSARTRETAAGPRATRRRGPPATRRAGVPRSPAHAPARGRRTAGRSPRTRRRRPGSPRRRARARRRLERRDHAVGADPLGDLDAVVVRDERRGLGRAEPVEAGAVLAPDLEQVGEARGRDQRGPRAALLEQRVGADRHPVREALDLRRPRPGAFERRLDRRQHPLRLILGGRGRLRREHLLAVEQDRVRERPTDVYSQQHAPKLSSRGPRGNARGPGSRDRGLVPIPTAVPRTACPVFVDRMSHDLIRLERGCKKGLDPAFATQRAGGVDDQVDAVEGRVGEREVGASMRAARLGAVERRRGDQARQRVGVVSSRSRPAASRSGPGVLPDRLAGRGGRRLEAPLGKLGRSAARAARRARPAAARAPNTKHSLSEFEASRLAPCRPRAGALADREQARAASCARRGRVSTPPIR